MDNENKIIQKCQQGDLSEFGQLYSQHVQGVYQFVYFKTHHKETAEDLTSITFVKALKNLKNFDLKKASFKTWLYQIARNTVIDHYRTHHPTEALEDAWTVGDRQDIEKDTDLELKMQSIQAYMQKLKPEQREVVLLRVWGGHTFVEIAQIMGKTEAACKMNFKRVVEKLRDEFAPFLILLLLFK